MIFEEEEEEDEDVVVVVGLGLEKEWKKAWGLVNMITFFLCSFLSCWSELEWLAKGTNSFFPERSSRQRRRSVMNVMSESVQFDRQTGNFSFSDDAG